MNKNSFDDEEDELSNVKEEKTTPNPSKKKAANKLKNTPELTLNEQKLSVSKTDLEIQKLKLEISNLSLDWWKKPSYISILIPSFLTFTSLIYALCTGFFDKKYEKHQIEKESLKLEILKFELTKNALIHEKDSALLLVKKVLHQKDSLIRLANNLKLEQEILRNYQDSSNVVNSFNLQYDILGRITQIKRPDSLVTTYTYDSLSRLTHISAPQGKMISYEYDSKGNLISVTNEQGDTKTFVYDK